MAIGDLCDDMLQLPEYFAFFVCGRCSTKALNKKKIWSILIVVAVLICRLGANGLLTCIFIAAATRSILCYLINHCKTVLNLGSLQMHSNITNSGGVGKCLLKFDN